MNRFYLVSALSIIIFAGITVFAGGSLLSSEGILGSIRYDQVAPNSGGRVISSGITNEGTCGLFEEVIPSCQETEQRILSMTLRIEIKTWIIYVEDQGYKSLFSGGHGTVMNGRYLLTHNHFGLPLLELLADDFNGEFAKITLYTANGDLLWQGPLTTASVAYDDSETLLIEFLDKDGRGLFESLGIPSADFAAEGISQVTPGATVAQVNWDNEQAFIQWTQVENVSTGGITNVVILEDCIIGGSSGGGVFFNGKHIANNWSRSGGCVEGSHDASTLYSKAALNSAELLATGKF